MTMFELLNGSVSGPNSTSVHDWESEPAMCSGYLDPENEDRRDFEAKLDGKAGSR